jgi:hypothetical protein
VLQKHRGDEEKEMAEQTANTLVARKLFLWHCFIAVPGNIVK